MVTQKALGRYLDETDELSQKSGVPAGTVKKVLKALEEKIISNRRQPAPEPPAGSISQSAGARKYDVDQSTISRWVREGFIPVLLRTKKEVYIDESRLAEVAKAYKKKPGRGRRTVQQRFKTETAS